MLPKRRMPSGWVDEIIQEAKKRIPNIHRILTEALERLPCGLKFGEALQKLDYTATQIYLRYEQEALKFVAERWLEAKQHCIADELEVWRQLIHTKGWEAFKERAANFFTDFAQWVHAKGTQVPCSDHRAIEAVGKKKRLPLTAKFSGGECDDRFGHRCMRVHRGVGS